MISALAGLVLALSGLGVFALMPRVKLPQQQRVLRLVAGVDVAVGVVAVTLGLVGIAP